jgi:hypothetical protein
MMAGPGHVLFRSAIDVAHASTPPTPGAWDAVNQSVHEAMIRHHTRIRPEHFALAFTAMTTGLVPSILSAVGTSAPALHTAILERNWQAS